MRIPLLSATCVASLSIFCLASITLAQGVPGGQRPPQAAAAPAAAPAGMNVAVIDVAKVFKSHNRFNAAMNDIKTEIEQFEAQVRAKQTALRTKSEGLQSFKGGSPEYRALEEELARASSDMQVEVGLKKREFLEQEARVYYRVYKEIEQEVAVMSRRFRISLVLRYNGDDMKEDDRASVLQGVNRAVVFQDGLDITEPILKTLNQGTTTVAPAGQGPSTTGGQPAPQLSPNRPTVPRPGTTTPR